MVLAISWCFNFYLAVSISGETLEFLLYLLCKAFFCCNSRAYYFVSYFTKTDVHDIVAALIQFAWSDFSQINGNGCMKKRGQLTVHGTYCIDLCKLWGMDCNWLQHDKRKRKVLSWKDVSIVFIHCDIMSNIIVMCSVVFFLEYDCFSVIYGLMVPACVF